MAGGGGGGGVQCTVQDTVIPTYEPQPPDRNPMYLENRVYQGSSGTVYPLPVYNRISSQKTDHKWKAIYLENDYVEVMILPELGGRIHAAKDKTNGYDFIYRQNVIKPALVGLSGPWISGGIEFNWPQHHRPATYMAVNYKIEHHADTDAITVWLSDHDPLQRMKGMHGVCLYPDKAIIELKVRAYNRTDKVQTFLWWANVATRVHEQYQSFFPPDVHYVADHAKRATSRYPLCQGHYYGVNYGQRGLDGGVPEKDVPTNFVPPHCRRPNLKKQDDDDDDATDTYAPNDLSWYANIPVPTSYMCMGTEGDFFGGYDHAKQAGLVHIANHHIAPGKKQWTWGNHDFGYAWDRNLTDEDGPYIELMAGVYTDNQPDFSFLMPGETKTWSQYWYPIKKIGIPQQADIHRAVRLIKNDNDQIELGVAGTSAAEETSIRLTAMDSAICLLETVVALSPSNPFKLVLACPPDIAETDLQVEIASGKQSPKLFYQPQSKKDTEVPASATEPPLPEEIQSADELYIAGLHLSQYRHATRSPIDYWLEAIKRDSGDFRCNNAVGRWHLDRGEFKEAITFFNTAIKRLTLRNPNPLDGEPYYNLGCALRAVKQPKEAYAAFYKATWNMAWQAPAYHAIAELDCCRKSWTMALTHIDKSLRYNVENLRARNLKAMILRKLDRGAEAETLLAESAALDPLDWWTRWLKGDELGCDSQACIDIALDLKQAGFTTEALSVLQAATPEPFYGTAPTIGYLAAWIQEANGQQMQAAESRARAAAHDPDYCFPFKVEELLALQAAVTANPKDARAHYYLGNLLYGRRRHKEAVEHWQRAVEVDPTNAVAFRNIGIGAYNILKNEALALKAFDQAVAHAPTDSRLFYERDQLWKRTGFTPKMRIQELEKFLEIVKERDDLALEYCMLLNQVGRPQDAQSILYGRIFQPWEGGEGVAFGQHVRSNLLLGRACLESNPEVAKTYFDKALTSPKCLGEAKHLLVNQSDVHYWQGCALNKCGETEAAKQAWTLAADFKGDFQNMEVRSFSEMTYYSALSMEQLGRKKEANALLEALLDFALTMEKEKAKIDYFATSLPTMLLFEADIQDNQEATARFLQAQAKLGLGQTEEARELLQGVLKSNPNHALAHDLL